MQEMIVLQTEIEAPDGKKTVISHAPAPKVGHDIRVFRPNPVSKPNSAMVKERQTVIEEAVKATEETDDNAAVEMSEDTIAFAQVTGPEDSAEVPQAFAEELPTPYRGQHFRGLLRFMISGALLAAIAFCYPQYGSYFDRFNAFLLGVNGAGAFAGSREESAVSEVSEETMPELSKPEEHETADFTSSEISVESSALPDVWEETSRAPIIGTIDNMSGDGTVSVQTFAQGTGGRIFSLGSGLCKNVTDLSNETLLKAAGSGAAFAFEDKSGPQVLIMHTHTTESYLSAQSETYDTGASFRTRDETQNMVRVGNAIAESLKGAGIEVLHDKTQHDYPSYTGAYERSATTVKRYLEQYPSIKIVLDIHRDAIGSEGKIVAPTTEINGRRAAQVMIICGCDDGTMDMPQYLKNFGFAAMLQNRLEEDYPTLTRPMLFDYRKYNQDLTTGSLLIEVGGHGNTLDEAVYSGSLIGNAVAAICNELQGQV